LIIKPGASATLCVTLKNKSQDERRSLRNYLQTFLKTGSEKEAYDKQLITLGKETNQYGDTLLKDTATETSWEIRVKAGNNTGTTRISFYIHDPKGTVHGPRYVDVTVRPY